MDNGGRVGIGEGGNEGRGATTFGISPPPRESILTIVGGGRGRMWRRDGCHLVVPARPVFARTRRAWHAKSGHFGKPLGTRTMPARERAAIISSILERRRWHDGQNRLDFHGRPYSEIPCLSLLNYREEEWRRASLYVYIHSSMCPRWELRAQSSRAPS